MFLTPVDRPAMWSTLLGKPTTISGFGITDAVENAGGVQAARALTELEYDGLLVKDPATLYIIIEPAP